jgi:hypothetical protein
LKPFTSDILELKDVVVRTGFGIFGNDFGISAGKKALFIL